MIKSKNSKIDGDFKYDFFVEDPWKRVNYVLRLIEKENWKGIRKENKRSKSDLLLFDFKMWIDS